MENYRDAKAKLFTQSKISVINIDDPYGEFMKNIATGKVLTYSIEKESDLKATNINYTSLGTEFDIVIEENIYRFTIPIPGKFSVYNALGVLGAALTCGVPVEIIQSAFKKLKVVPGRIQRVDNDKNLNVIVDYAHTPDGLENIIKAVRGFTEGKVITVFGCGGDRDKEKRPIMGKIADELSDFCVLTSDNPRSEDPASILDDIEKGLATSNFVKIVDRYEAIKYAVEMATPKDSVIIAGKGHENYQIFKEETIHFDDVEVAKKVLT